MKSHIHTHNSVNGAGTRNSISRVMPYMTEQQLQAYLMAREAIRRVQRASSGFDSYEKHMTPEHRAADGQRNFH